MKKFIKFAIVGILLLVIIAAVGVFLSLNFLIRSSVERFGPRVTQTDVELDSVRISPFSGKGELRGLVIGNPEGFNTDDAFRLGQIRVVLDPGSLRTDTIVIRELVIEAPKITYERSLRSSNLNDLMANVESFAKRFGGDGDTAESGGDSSKKVVIEHFLLSNANVRVSSTVLQGRAVTATVPDIELFDLGKGSGQSLNAAEVIELVLETVTSTIFSTIPDVAELLKGATDTVRGVTGQATDTVRGVTGQAADTVKNVGEGATGLLRGVLGRKDDEEE